MSTGLAVVDRRGRRLGTLTWAGALTWLAVIAPIFAVAVWLTRVAPDTPWWPGPALLVLAVATAALPDSPTGLVTITGACAWWVVAATDEPLSGSIVVAAALLVFHVATAHAAAGPPGRTTDRASVLRLAGRSALVLAATTALWLVAMAAEGRVVVPPVVLGAALLTAGAVPLLGVRR
jgi:hypothetical protein